jgi:electron transport complex protein RnfD
MWISAAALLPLWALRLLAEGGNALSTLTIVFFSCAVVEIFSWRFASRRLGLANGSLFLAALLIALVLPPRSPGWLALVGAWGGMILGRELFGGFAQHVFHPALVAHALLAMLFPRSMEDFSWAQGFGLPPQAAQWAAFTGGAILVRVRLVSWKVPVCHIGAAIFCWWVLTQGLPSGSFLAGVLIAAFFFCTDPVTTPVEENGRILFAAGSACLAVLITVSGSTPHGETYALLFMNACVPLIDRFLRRRFLGEGRLERPEEGISGKKISGPPNGDTINPPEGIFDEKWAKTIHYSN